MEKGNVKVLVSNEMHQLLDRVGDNIVMKMDLGSYVTPDGRYYESDKLPIDDGHVFTYIEWVIAEKAAAGKYRTADNYRAALRRLCAFCESTDGSKMLRWHDLTPDFMKRFECHLLCEGISKNTSSFYMRILRAICNRARRSGHGVAWGLFEDVYTGKAKTRKRALTMDVIRLIAHADTNNEVERMARDLFVFSFLTRGMSMIDIAHLKRSDINGGRLSYRRRKTGQRLCVEWLEEMQRITMTYYQGARRYVFPIILSEGEEGYREYQKFQNKINNTLKRIGNRLGIANLTMYVARHSWATIARSAGVPVMVISDALGHDSERTTQIYLDSVDEGRIDAANRQMIHALKLGDFY